jgi:hypothetical protein
LDAIRNRGRWVSAVICSPKDRAPTEGPNGDILSIPRDPLRFDLLQLCAGHVGARGSALQDLDTQGSSSPA